ncbi:RNA polymerase sigma factor [Caulobacter sp. KR2-114]|uniref:RNA polymerase sigma factor n=1 Tax=Caulobacter sp. KR2-114 TaxID=3400912 RepID=UPI003C11982A
MARSDVHGTILATWRIEQPRLIATLARMLRDVPLAEELTQDALVAALERWPRDGAPERPGAWLMAAARRRALDHIRREPMLARRHAMLAASLQAEQAQTPDLAARLDDDIGDEMLRLIFTACHPQLPRWSRAALALRMVCGLTTEEIARAFLMAPATVAQRIVRAKRQLSEAGLAYETPQGQERDRRLPTVLDVVYLIFNEGYTAARGDDWMRPRLCDEARRLGRVLTALAPSEPEVQGLMALMELNASRSAARIDAEGEPILLMDQDRRAWDALQIRRGLDALARAQALGGGQGFYALQAAIVACHARARTPEETDWPQIVDLYGQLAAVSGSPVVELNRAIAVAMVDGPAAGLALVEALASAPALKDYHLLPSVRGDLLQRLGRLAEAREAFSLAAAQAGNARERALLDRRAAACAPDSPSPP